MSAPPLLNAAGRRRSPVTLPGHLAGRRRATTGCATRPIRSRSRRSSWSCARPATTSTARPHAGLDRAALARGAAHQRSADLTEHDLDTGLGAILVRHGKGRPPPRDRHGLLGWEHLRPWLELRMRMPVGPLLCVIDGRTRGRPWPSDAARARLRRRRAAVMVASHPWSSRRGSRPSA
jgi:hypothetical protein